MDPKKTLDEFENQRKKNQSEYEKLTKEEKKIIEKNVNEMTKIVKDKLDENNIRITSITSHFSKNSLLRDETKKDVIITSFNFVVLNHRISVVTDAETLDMLYVRTGPVSYVEIEDYFTPYKDEDYED